MGDQDIGPCFTDANQIDKQLIGTTKDSDKLLVTYSNNALIHVKSGEHYGSLKIFDSKYGAQANPCVLIKKGPVVRHLKEIVEKKLRNLRIYLGKTIENTFDVS